MWWHLRTFWFWETRVKEDSRSNEKDLKLTVDGIESDMQKLENELNEAMAELQESIDKQIKTTLANPFPSFSILILDFSFSQGTLTIHTPVDRLCTLVEMTILNDPTE